MDELDRAIVNRLQEGFPLCARPFAAAAASLGTTEHELLAALGRMLEAGTLTRFGPLYDAERLGGGFNLCAMRVPAEDLERVATLVNAHPEVAHNYERAHRYSMWFVIAATSPSRIAQLTAEIEAETGYPVMNLPREDAFRLELRLRA